MYQGQNNYRRGNYQNQKKDSEKVDIIEQYNNPLSEIYRDVSKIYLNDGKAYNIAKAMCKVPSHQMRKILNEVKDAVKLSKEGKFEEARNRLYFTVPLTAYNAGRNPGLKELYKFVVQHINKQTLKSEKDIEVLDQLFTSIIAYHKYFKELKKR